MKMRAGQGILPVFLDQNRIIVKGYFSRNSFEGGLPEGVDILRPVLVLVLVHP